MQHLHNRIRLGKVLQQMYDRDANGNHVKQHAQRHEELNHVTPAESTSSGEIDRVSIPRWATISGHGKRP